MNARQEDDGSRRLGASIRALRLRQGLTLVQLAGKAELSHSFLSQLERGRARPSMMSLHRIARALGTSQQALMAADPAVSPSGTQDAAVSLVRAGEGTPLAHGQGMARSLVRGTRPMYPVEYTGTGTAFEEYWTHPGDEFVHVVTGHIEVDLDTGGLHTLHPGDSLYYAGGIRHRWRALSGDPVRLVVVQEGKDPHP